MYLGIDLGTSSVKTLLMDDNEEIVAEASTPLQISHPEPLWSEQNPEAWWLATCQAIHPIKTHYPKALSATKVIGLSGQQHGATLLDNKNCVIRPAMLWNDGRAMTQCHALGIKVNQHETIIGSKLMPGFTAPKVEWVREKEAHHFKRIHKILLPKDYLRLKMTGDYATDLSDASGTAWLNIATRTWSSEMLEASELDHAQMPTLFEGTAVTGKITAEVANLWGMSSTTRVVAGGGDNPAGAIGVNVTAPGRAFLSLGTSGVYFVASDKFNNNPSSGIHSFCHCLPNQWHQMSVHLSAASCLGWLASVTNTSDPAILLNEVQTQAFTAHKIYFLPYLSGERTPHINPHAKGVFFGMTHQTTRADLTRAVLEGIAFAFADGQDALLTAGASVDDVSVIGGGSKSLYWGNILANALNRPLIYRANREIGAALGAARLAWLADHPTDLPDALSLSPIENIAEPDITMREIYLEKRAVFKKLYSCLKEIFIPV